MVEEHKLDAGQIAGSGRDGRISKGDVIQHMAGKDAAPAKPAAAKPAPAVKLPTPTGTRTEQRVPMTACGRASPSVSMQAQSTAAMLTTFNEVDLTAVNEIRARYKDKFEKKHGVKLGFMSFFVKASIEALRRFPAVNASLDGNDIVYHEFYDIGVAVSTDRGLMVPVLRNAEMMSFAEIEVAVGAYAQKARDGSITLEELTGGTFTLTNGGVFGSLMSTPILNPPQVAILGMHKIQERPMVIDGEIKAAPDDVPGADLRSSDRRRPRVGAIPGRDQGSAGRPRAASTAVVGNLVGQPRHIGVGLKPDLQKAVSQSTRSEYDNPIRCDCHRRRSRRLSLRDPRRPAQAEGRLHRRVAEQGRLLRVRRHLPERGLHSLEGDARIVRAVSSRAARVRVHGEDRQRAESRPCTRKRPRRSSTQSTLGIAGLFKGLASRACRDTASCSAAIASSTRTKTARRS